MKSIYFILSLLVALVPTVAEAQSSCATMSATGSAGVYIPRFIVGLSGSGSSVITVYSRDFSNNQTYTEYVTLGLGVTVNGSWGSAGGTTRITSLQVGGVAIGLRVNGSPTANLTFSVDMANANRTWTGALGTEYGLTTVSGNSNGVSFGGYNQNTGVLTSMLMENIPVACSAGAVINRYSGIMDIIVKPSPEDMPVTSVTFYINGYELVVEKTSPPWIFEYDTTQNGLGNGYVYVNTITKVAGLPDIVTAGQYAPVHNSTLAAGGRHTCMIDDGIVKCWGDNEQQQLAQGPTSYKDSPKVITVKNAPHADATQIAAGRGHTCAIYDVSLYCWGDNRWGQVGVGSTGNTFGVPQLVSMIPGEVTSVAAGEYHTCASTHSGDMYCWGFNADGQVGVGNTTTQPSPQLLTIPAISPSSGVHVGLAIAGGFHSCAVARNAGVRAHCWGRNNEGQLGNYSNVDVLEPPISSNGSILSLGGGKYHNCVTQGGGAPVTITLKCTGKGNVGQQGRNNTVTYNNYASSPPVVLPAPQDQSAHVVSGGHHTCLRVQDAFPLTSGSLYCTGYNAKGQLGDNTTTDKLILTAVSGMTSGVGEVSAGDDHTCAIHNGVPKCWGDNSNGELGDGTLINRSVPTTVYGY